MRRDRARVRRARVFTGAAVGFVRGKVHADARADGTELVGQTVTGSIRDPAATLTTDTLRRKFADVVASPAVVSVYLEIDADSIAVGEPILANDLLG